MNDPFKSDFHIKILHAPLDSFKMAINVGSRKGILTA